MPGVVQGEAVQFGMAAGKKGSEATNVTRQGDDGI